MEDVNVSDTKDGGPAFPTPSAERVSGAIPGMALRDWFAGQALAGLLAPGFASAASAFAEDAYKLADAMLAARAKKDGET